MSQTTLIIEDHPLYRAALTTLMQAIVGESEIVAVSSVEEGLRMIGSRFRPVLILLDFCLPGLDGTEAIAALFRQCPAVPIIVVSASDDRLDAHAALRAGARHFVSKALPTEAMTDVVRRVLADVPQAPEWITPGGRAARDDVSELKLTPRQQETLALLAQGHSNKEIGLRLGLAEVTIKVHVSAIFRELDVVNRTQAVLAMRRLGLCLDQREPAATG